MPQSYVKRRATRAAFRVGLYGVSSLVSLERLRITARPFVF